MRNYLLVYINGQRVEIRGADAFLTLSDFLRQRHGMTGTKIVCSEGDCGACTVLVGRPTTRGRTDHRRLSYQGVDSCILFMHQVDGAHVVTIEGLEHGDQLHPIQQAMVDCFGSQCGFCTPGFVNAMVARLEGERDGKQRDANPSKEAWQTALTGNLCRCTGYVQILEAAQAGAPLSPRIEALYPSAQLITRLDPVIGSPVEIEVVASENGRRRHLGLPVDLDSAVRFKSDHPDARIVGGATDVGVLTNKRRIDPDTILSLGNLTGFDELTEKDDCVTFGVRTTWTQIEHWAETALPEFHRIILRFGSPQIRNVSTLIGNVANGSPIADSMPLLMVMEAELELISPSRTRWVNINDFYLGYKKLDLRADELIARVTMPLPADDEHLRLYKVSKRNDLDISTFTAAIRLQISGETIVSAKVAYGGVGPTVLRLPKTEAFLTGKPIEEVTFRQASQLARGEVAPISDVRGSAEYRLQLAENIPLKFFCEMQARSA